MTRHGNTLAAGTFAVLLVTAAAGCSTSRNASDGAKGGVAAVGVRVGEVRDESPREARNARVVLGSFDPALELRERLHEELARANLAAAGAQPSRGPLTLDARIVDYRPGNALVRWLIPGTGRTILAVEGRLVDADGRVVHTVRSRRTVIAGDGNTLGQWHKIFGTVAADLAADVKQQLHSA